ncbi:MAG: hypothetical protein J6P28_00990 [Treponema sp.]|nr:hypothetical protein [Treponema sp.]
MSYDPDEPMTLGDLVIKNTEKYVDLVAPYNSLVEYVSQSKIDGENNPSFIKDENIREEMLTLFASIYDELDFEGKYGVFFLLDRLDDINRDLHFVKSLYSTLEKANLSDKTKLAMIKSIVQRRMQNK